MKTTNNQILEDPKQSLEIMQKANKRVEQLRQNITKQKEKQINGGEK